MSEHGGQPGRIDERLELGTAAAPVVRAAAALGALGLLLSIIVGYLHGDSFRRFYFAYLTNYAYFLSIALGALFFVMLQHLTRAGWSVNVRRVPEAIAGTLPLLGLLAMPILISVAAGDGRLYRWALPLPHPDEAAHAAPAAVVSGGHGAVHDSHGEGLDAITLSKRWWLNPGFFTARVVAYLVLWALMGWWFWRGSTRQDRSGDVALTRAMELASGPMMLLYAITATLAAFDLLMSLDPHWYSTIFGVYWFAGAVVGALAAVIAGLMLLQSRRFLARGVTTEHYHDLGKYLFAFVFFWGYIAFSQYMLLWYANIPETTAWFLRRGATTVAADQSAWTVVCLLLVFGHLLIPFGGLLSKHVKRNRAALCFWAVWLLLFHWLDIAWLVMPEYSRSFSLGALEVLTFLGIGGLTFAAATRLLAGQALRPLRDPRLEESLVFENV